MPRSAVVALVAALLATAAPAFSEVGDVTEGENLYRLYCAACHGPTGEGNGPTAELMTLDVTDLTGLSAANGGDFPVGRVAMQVDGRDPLLAHGGPMPLFGSFFEGDDVALKTSAGQPILTSRPIADLVAWLRTIQSE